jgi:hypothetical protein
LIGGYLSTGRCFFRGQLVFNQAFEIIGEKLVDGPVRARFESLYIHQNCNNISQVWTTARRCGSFEFLAGARPMSAATSLAEGREVIDA